LNLFKATVFCHNKIKDTFITFKNLTIFTDNKFSHKNKHFTNGYKNIKYVCRIFHSIWCETVQKENLLNIFKGG